MNSIDKLSEIFAKFPGIGPRQAKRFVYFILTRQNAYASELTQAIQDLKKEIVQCRSCLRFFAKNGGVSELCSICSNDTRDNSILMVLPRDIDLESIEKSGSYNGYYFVLGGVVPVLEKEPETRIRVKELKEKIKSNKNINEIILAMNANIDGENTGEYLKSELSKIVGASVTISVLGRGLSTGAELEYVDPETIKNALIHRTK